MKTLSKKALKNPRRWAAGFADELGLSNSARAELFDSVKNLDSGVDRLNRLMEQRGRASRAIGKERAIGADPSDSMAKVKNFTQEIQDVESELMIRLMALAEKAESDAPENNTLPEVSITHQAPDYFQGTPTYQDQGIQTPTDKIAVTTVDSDKDVSDYTRYLRAHPARTAYHEIELGKLITRTNGQRCHYLIARGTVDGTVKGLLPLTHLNSRLFGNFMVSMPWFNYGGTLADDDHASDALAHAAGNIARQHGCSHVEIRETFQRPGWKTRTDKVSMTLALPTTIEELDRRLGSSVRAQSNKAARVGCTFQVGGLELLDDFYRVFCINMRDLGTPVQSRAFFEDLLKLFGNDAFLSVVRKKGQPLASGFLLAHGDGTLEIPWASSLRKANSLGVNMLLYRRTLAEAIARGYQHFDFGRSTVGESTWRFKRQWGAVQQQLYWHYWANTGDDVFGPSAESLKFRIAIAAWQRLPVALTTHLGPHLVRGLP